MNFLRKIWRALFRGPDLGGLTYEEYEDYEFLGCAVEWRALSKAEETRFEELSRRRKDWYAGIK